MAIPQPAQGALNQMKPPAPQPAGAAKFDAGAAQAENLEKITQSKSSNLSGVVSDELEDQRKALNDGLLRMRESLDSRKNRWFDPVLMQTAAGFLKPTKTGSFGESLGYAAENAGVAAERESVFQRDNQKLEMELLAKEQELRKMMGGDRFMTTLLSIAPSGIYASPPSSKWGTPPFFIIVINPPRLA